MYWRATAVRALLVFLQVMITLMFCTWMDILDTVDWTRALAVGGAAALASLVVSVLGLAFEPVRSIDLVDSEPR